MYTSVFILRFHFNSNSIMNILTSEQKLNRHEFKEDKIKREKKIGDILAAQNGNNSLLSNLKDRLSRVENDLQVVNSVSCIQDSLNTLDSYLQQVLVKINLNQASILDLSKYDLIFS